MSTDGVRGFYRTAQGSRGLSATRERTATAAELVRHNLALVMFMARRYGRHEELLSVASVGLVEAARRYKADQGVRFASYACAVMRGHMLNWIAGEVEHTGKDRASLFDESLYSTRGPDLDRRLTLIDVKRRIARRLTARETLTLKRHCEGFTLEETGNLLGITKERVRQILRGAITKLKRLAN